MVELRGSEAFLLGRDVVPRRTAETISEAVQAVNRRWPGALIKASDPSLRIEHLPTGILALDMVVGGFARGRHTEIYGGYNIGKTATTYKLIATSQAAGLKCAFMDVEGTFDPDFASHLGVDLDLLEFPEHGQNANRLVNIMETLLRSEEYDVIVLDSIAALMPASEEDADMEQGSYGTAQAKLMSQALRRLTAANKRTALVYINQTRQAIGVVFGNKAITSGGRAMGFYAGTRLEMIRIETLKRSTKQVDTKTGKSVSRDIVRGHRVLIKVEKDKTGAVRNGAETTYVFDYDNSCFDPIEDLIYLGRLYGLVHLSSGNKWWVEGFKEETASGRPRFYKWLKTNRAVAEELEEMIRAKSAEVDESESGEAEAEPEEQPTRAKKSTRRRRANPSRQR